MKVIGGCYPLLFIIQQITKLYVPYITETNSEISYALSCVCLLSLIMLSLGEKPKSCKHIFFYLFFPVWMYHVFNIILKSIRLP